MSKQAWFYREIVVPNEMYGMLCLYQSILKWDSIAQEEFASQTDEKKMQEVPSFYDKCEFTAIMLLDTKRIMFASLSGVIAARVEHFLDEICQARAIALTTKANLRQKKQAIESHFGIRLEDIAGFKEWKMARLMNNCYKHNGGEADEEYANAYGLERGYKIEYELVEWQSIIYKVRDFLTGLSNKL